MDCAARVILRDFDNVVDDGGWCGHIGDIVRGRLRRKTGVGGNQRRVGVELTEYTEEGNG